MPFTSLVDNSEWMPFEEYKTYYSIQDGVLMSLPMNLDGSIDDTEEPSSVECLVNGEEEDGFLEKINTMFASDFEYSSFIISPLGKMFRLRSVFEPSGMAAVASPSVPIVVVGPHVPLCYSDTPEEMAKELMEWLDCEVMVLDEPVYDIRNRCAAIEIRADFPDARSLKAEPAAPTYRQLEYGKKKRRW